MTGDATTRLVILRGNSASGKSTTAKELRRRVGCGVAWVEQDYLRRTLLLEHPHPGTPNIGLIDQTTRYALDHGYHEPNDLLGVPGEQLIDESSSLEETAERIIGDLAWTTGGAIAHSIQP